MNRQDILNSLINFDRPLPHIEHELSDFSWDVDFDLVTLKKRHIIDALTKYINEIVSSQEIEQWANLIEGREDIKYEEGSEETIKEAIFELANPTLVQPISDSSAKEMIIRLA